jgi:hypothetical protein
MKYTLALLAFLWLSLPVLNAQTASTTVTATTITTVVKDAAGNAYTITTPYTIAVQPGSTSLVVTPVVISTPPPPTDDAPAIPASATAVSLITGGTWKACEHDAGTPGTGKCSNNYPVTGVMADAARAFSMTYGDAGGVRYANSFAKDTAAQNFVLDGEFQSPDWTHVANLELDTNQVKANGKTSILGTQCSSYSKTWEITLTDSAGAWHWVPTNVACNPLTWTPNTPHHVRIFGTINASAISTYTGVELDGVYSAFSGASGSTADALGWAVGTVLTNVQIDGLGTSGSATVYSDKLTIYRW